MLSRLLQIAFFLKLGAESKSFEIFSNLDYRYFVAGGTCAAISHGITTPIDVVKTRIQANPEKYDKGMRAAAIDIIKEDGPQALLGGLGPTVVGYGIEGMFSPSIFGRRDLAFLRSDEIRSV